MRILLFLSCGGNLYYLESGTSTGLEIIVVIILPVLAILYQIITFKT